VVVEVTMPVVGVKDVVVSGGFVAEVVEDGAAVDEVVVEVDVAQLLKTKIAAMMTVAATRNSFFIMFPSM